ncbi:hypothetical protein MNBD_GAMMA15-754 [hydrothermal vent metagenome]|uniref:Prepilin-type N-terminal cleavage/methylation domain-containing protein n=1 Tax=hydrothermal vent metagenome TaxID=652676 RepID=A0A3B0YKV1_9ZZZZ
MKRQQTGFSLTEALITLLILSIGWLGLGQLQTRLSIATMNRSSEAFAQLTKSTYYEKTVGYDVSDIQNSLPVDERLNTPSSRYDIRVSRITNPPLRNTTIQIEWEEIGNTRNESIPFTLSRGPQPSDTRWLLLSP